MMGFYIRNGAPLLVVFLITTMCDSFDAWPKFLTPRVTRVRINNNLGFGTSLGLHCKSKDDDLGEHVLPPNGNYEFKFRPNLLGTTQFFCSMKFDGKTEHFDIYIQDRDQRTCFSFCDWSVNRDGVCLFRGRTLKYDICFPWNT